VDFSSRTEDVELLVIVDEFLDKFHEGDDIVSLESFKKVFY